MIRLMDLRLAQAADRRSATSCSEGRAAAPPAVETAAGVHDVDSEIFVVEVRPHHDLLRDVVR